MQSVIDSFKYSDTRYDDDHGRVLRAGVYLSGVQCRRQYDAIVPAVGIGMLDGVRILD